MTHFFLKKWKQVKNKKVVKINQAIFFSKHIFRRIYFQMKIERFLCFFVLKMSERKLFSPSMSLCLSRRELEMLLT